MNLPYRNAKILEDVKPEDLLQYGLIPEFVGRLPVIVSLTDLDTASLIKILTEPKNALIKQYQQLFHMDNVTLSVEPDALKAIAKKSIALKTGARGLRSILEDVLLDTMYDLPSMQKIREVILTKDAIDKKTEPLIVYEGTHRAQCTDEKSMTLPEPALKERRIDG